MEYTYSSIKHMEKVELQFMSHKYVFLKKNY